MKRAALLAALLLALPLMAQQRTIKVLVVTGGHNYTTGFYTLFQGYPDVKWDHAQHCAAGEGYLKDMAGKYDVVVLYDMPKEVPEGRQKNLMDFLTAGRGVVVLHHALATMPAWTAFHDAIGGKYLTQAEGSRPASTYQHDVRMRVTVAGGGHPVTRGIPDFEIFDEIYGGLWVAENAQVLLTTDHPSSSRALAWVMPHPRSRVVTIQPGHGEEAFANPNYRKLVIQAIRWSAGVAGRP